jgi:hypothetical protein
MGSSWWDHLYLEVDPIRLSREWEEALLHQLFTELDTKGIIDIEDLDCDAANRCTTDKVGSFPLKMARPFVPTRVKQRR